MQPTKAALYLRVSTDEQVSGYGLAVQRQRCEAQAIAKGWEVVEIYSDEGLSGTREASERPALAQLLADMRAGRFDAVIVLALDRLGRRTRIVLSLVDELGAAGVALVSCKESLDTSTPQGSFVLTMFAALAQLERDTIVERTSAGRNARGRVDGEKGGRLPFGYIRSTDGPIVEDEAAELVRLIFQRRAAGATLRAIAADLPGASPRGGRWYASGVREVLLNEHAYRGGSRGASDRAWPAILE